MESKAAFDWIPFYSELADALIPYRTDRGALLEKIEHAYRAIGMKLPKLDSEKPTDIDPFTVYGLFNKGITTENRMHIIGALKSELGVNASVPTQFDGIPVMNNLSATFYLFKSDRGDDDIEILWDAFAAAYSYAENKVDRNRAEFVRAYDAARQLPRVKWNLTMALYWMKPYAYLNLDSRNRWALTVESMLGPGVANAVASLKGAPPTAEEYLSIVDLCEKELGGGDRFACFPELSRAAWLRSEQVNKEKKARIDDKGNQGDDDWFPSADEYDPGISVEQWVALLSDSNVTTTSAQAALTRLASFDNGATCRELSDEFGETSNYYQNAIVAFANRICKTLGIAPLSGASGDSTYWAIPCVGKRAKSSQKGTWVWKLRSELREAMGIAGFADANRRVWMYSPGAGAWAWDEFREKGIMAIGWDDLGDLSVYESQGDIMSRLRELDDSNGLKMNDTLACWQFQNVMKPGDIVYAKRGMQTIVGRGVVKSPARFEADRERYRHVRDIDWNAVGEWDVSDLSIPMKTLTDWTFHHDAVREIESRIDPEVLPSATRGGESDSNYWWLVASPRIWSFSDIKVGGEQRYTLRNEKGNPRRIQKNYLNAKPGDIVVGYEANPVGKVVALCTIPRNHDEECMYFSKICDVDTPLSFEEIKGIPELANMEFLKNPNGSFFKLTKEEFEIVEELVMEEDSPLVQGECALYTDADFLSQVYMDAVDLAKLKELLRRKKNLILQGAPGTGKTFAARRLAYAAMGRADDSRIQQVQFHQGTSYDDFVYGYRPNGEGGFDPTPGVFVTFCRRAAQRPGEPFFFIIDEINRANISKVFGELLMLIEADHRGDYVTLVASGERFSVPDNVNIIGMMNTADRGLALIDYALRRRFAFFEMEPALSNPAFLAQVKKRGERMEKLVNAVASLNDDIASDPALGRGFRIGHSYFCVGDDAPADVATSIVEYEIVPLIEEYWFDDEDKAEAERKRLKDAVK